jgi:hypothetical protein
MSTSSLLASSLFLAFIFAPAVAQTVQQEKPATTQDSAQSPDSETTQFSLDLAPHVTPDHNPFTKLQIDQQGHTLLPWRKPSTGPVSSLSGLGDETCLFIRSYQVARDDAHSDSTHLVHTSTCQPARRFHVKTADLIQIPAAR